MGWSQHERSGRIESAGCGAFVDGSVAVGSPGCGSARAPGAPVGRDATAFSATRALDHIERLAVEPRPIGTPANERARGDIAAQLRLLGL